MISAGRLSWNTVVPLGIAILCSPSIGAKADEPPTEVTLPLTDQLGILIANVNAFVAVTVYTRVSLNGYVVSAWTFTELSGRDMSHLGGLYYSKTRTACQRC